MEIMDLQKTADYLEFAKIEQTINAGHTIIHLGISAAGFDFVLVNDSYGNTALTEGM